MRTKATFLAGLGTGYVLGSRAGRARYEQIRRSARSIAGSPGVHRATSSLQQQAGDVLATAREKASSVVADRFHDKRPAWLGSTAERAPGDASWAAGSNGHVGS